MIREIRHFVSVLIGRVPISRPLWCDHCPAVVVDLTQRQYQAYKDSNFEATACRCGKGLLRGLAREEVPA